MYAVITNEDEIEGLYDTLEEASTAAVDAAQSQLADDEDCEPDVAVYKLLLRAVADPAVPTTRNVRLEAD